MEAVRTTELPRRRPSRSHRVCRNDGFLALSSVSARRSGALSWMRRPPPAPWRRPPRLAGKQPHRPDINRHSGKGRRSEREGGPRRLAVHRNQERA